MKTPKATTQITPKKPMKIPSLPPPQKEYQPTKSRGSHYTPRELLHRYRYDIASLSLLALFILIYIRPILAPGHIIFSDLDFPMDSRRYMQEIFGLWNERWNTTTMLNIPRLIFTLIPWLISAAFGFSGSIFIKSYILILISTSALSLYLFGKRLLSIYISPHFTFAKTLALISGAFFYALNPWIIMRIQHLYLLCGYSLFPLMLLFLFQVFDPKFQRQLIPRYVYRRIGLYRRNLFDIVGLSLTISVMSAAIHYFFYSVATIFILVPLLFLKQYLVRFQEGRVVLLAITKNYLIKGGLSAIFILMFSYHWLAIYIGGILTGAGASQNNINVLDTLVMFSRHSKPLNVLYLNSYWWPMYNTEELGLPYYIGGGLILAIILFGIIKSVRRNHILLFLVAITSLFQVLATGTQIPQIAGIFVTLVQKVPLFGSIFRDPNKLIGLSALGYSIFIIFGLERLFRSSDRSQFAQSTGRLTISLMVILAFWGYNSVIRNNFIAGFYAPVEPPQEYADLNRHYKNLSKMGEAKRVLHFPVADFMTQPYSHVTSPHWNQNAYRPEIDKSTGDIAIYNSFANTVFHHEGSPPSLKYYLHFLFHIMNLGLSNSLGDLLPPLGVDGFTYVSDFNSMTHRQQFHHKLLAINLDLQPVYKNSIFTHYRINKPPATEKIDKSIWSPYGLGQLESWKRAGIFNSSRDAVIFTHLTQKPLIQRNSHKDWIDVDNFNQLWLSQLEPSRYLKPGKAVNESNPHLGWAQTAYQTSDWFYYLKTLEQQVDSFDFTRNSGIAATFVTAKLNIPPHHRSEMTGKVVMNLDSMIRLNQFFQPSNPRIAEINAYPAKDISDFPIIRGSIAKGIPRNIWQVAKSSHIIAKPDTPYRFKIAISGRGSNRMHAKMYFLNAEKDPIGVNYIVGPEEVMDFNRMLFTGEAVSPVNSKFMRLELMAMQRPEQKINWWIHELVIEEFSNVVVPNEIRLEKSFPREEQVEVYTRSFLNPKGGRIKVSLNGEEGFVETWNRSRAQFWWQHAGTFSVKPGSNVFLIENIKGFNAVNLLAVLPQREIPASRKIIEKSLGKSRQIIALEAEKDFEYEGTIQSERRYPALSMGNGIASYNGVLKRNVQLMGPGPWELGVLASGDSKEAEWEVIIQPQEEKKEDVEAGRQKISKTPQTESFHSNSPLSDNTHSKSPKLSSPPHSSIEAPKEPGKPITRLLVNHPGSLPSYQQRTWSGLSFPPGEYSIQVNLKYKRPSMISLSNISQFKSQIVKSPPYVEHPLPEDCSLCETVTPEMLNVFHERGRLRVHFAETCSCGWYIVTSPIVPVIAGDDYLGVWRVKSQNLRQRHAKIFFIDKHRRIINVVYTPEIDERKKENWHRYENIIRIPENTKWMMLQFWARGNPKSESIMEMDMLELHPYKRLPMLDMLYLKESRPAPAAGTHTPAWQLVRKNIPALPLWRLNNASTSPLKPEVSIQGLAAGFFIPNAAQEYSGSERNPGAEDTYLSIPLSSQYTIGLIIWPLTWLLIVFIRRKKGLLSLDSQKTGVDSPDSSSRKNPGKRSRKHSEKKSLKFNRTF